MQKRGMLSPVFKYIMALIVGVMFLLFFVGFGMQYLRGQKTVEGFMITQGFDDTLSALGASQDAQNTYKFGMDLQIEFTPGSKSGNYFNLQSSDQKYPIRSYKAIFSPETIRGTSLSILTKRWYFPYAVDNFFYITNNRHKHILIYNDEYESFAEDLVGSGDEEDLTAEIPKGFGFERVSEKDASSKKLKAFSKNFQTVTYIFLGENSNLERSLDKVPNGRIKVVKPDRNDPDYGKVLFEGGESVYMTKPMLLGAMFASDKRAYDRGVSIAMNKLGVITNIYEDKLGMMTSKAQYSQACANQYAPIRTSFDGLLRLARGGGMEYDEFKQYVEGLNNVNGGLGGDCPAIF